MSILHLGCGTVPMPHAVNVDSVALEGVDVVHDLDLYPWPFGDETFHEVKAQQLFEHVADPVAFMRECWRVLTPGGLLLVKVPDWQSKNAHTDPTHRRYCTDETFDYWCRGTHLYESFGQQMHGDYAIFDYEVKAIVNDDIIVLLRKVARWT